MGKNTDIKAVVANRHTVDIGGKSYGPGETVTLPEADVLELRACGFLVDPDLESAIEAEGASLTTDGGTEGATVTNG